MLRNKKLERYVKRYTGKEIKAYTVKCIKGGYGAYMSDRVLRIREDEMDYKPLIWHEIGHLMAWDDDWVKNEYKAQKWALRKLKKLNYKNLYKESIEWIKIWGKRNLTTYDIQYRIASKLLLKS